MVFVPNPKADSRVWTSAILRTPRKTCLCWTESDVVTHRMFCRRLMLFLNAHMCNDCVELHRIMSSKRQGT